MNITAVFPIKRLSQAASQMPSGSAYHGLCAPPTMVKHGGVLIKYGKSYNIVRK